MKTFYIKIKQKPKKDKIKNKRKRCALMIHGPPTSPLMRAAIVSVVDDNRNFGGKCRA
jgi:hypothetical protein